MSPASLSQAAQRNHPPEESFPQHSGLLQQNFRGRYMYEVAPLLDDPIHILKTIRDLYRWAVTEMENANLSYGHGSPTSTEDASFLICRALKLAFERFDMFLDAALKHN